MATDFSSLLHPSVRCLFVSSMCRNDRKNLLLNTAISSGFQADSSFSPFVSFAVSLLFSISAVFLRPSACTFRRPDPSPPPVSPHSTPLTPPCHPTLTPGLSYRIPHSTPCINAALTSIRSVFILGKALLAILAILTTHLLMADRSQPQKHKTQQNLRCVD